VYTNFYDDRLVGSSVGWIFLWRWLGWGGGFSGGARGDWQPWKAISRLTLHGAHSGATCRGPFVAQLHGEKKMLFKKGHSELFFS